MKKPLSLLLFAAVLLLCCTSCKKTEETDTPQTEETHTFAKAQVVIKVNINTTSGQILNLATDSTLRLELFYGQTPLVCLYDRSAFDGSGVFRDTVVFSNLPHRRQLRLEYRVPSSFSPKQLPCGLYFTVSASATRIDKEGKAYGDFSPEARVVSHTYYPATFSDTLLRRHLSEFNTGEDWIVAE